MASWSHPGYSSRMPCIRTPRRRSLVTGLQLLRYALLNPSRQALDATSPTRGWLTALLVDRNIASRHSAFSSPLAIARGETMEPVMSSSRFTTPPPRESQNLDLTPEQVKRIELNRLRGKYVVLVAGRTYS